MPSAPILDLTTIFHPYPNTKVICIIFYIVFHMESFQYLHDNSYMQFNQGQMCGSLTTKIHYTHPKHVLQNLYGPFRLTTSLRMKSYTKVQSSTPKPYTTIGQSIHEAPLLSISFLLICARLPTNFYSRPRQLPSFYQDGKE